MDIIINIGNYLQTLYERRMILAVEQLQKML